MRTKRINEARWEELLGLLGRAPRHPLPLGNKSDPLDELVYILLTVMTRSQPRIDRAFEGLVALAGDRGWLGLLDSDEPALDDVLRPLGFVNRRRGQILEVLRRVREDLDGTLDALDDMSDDEAMDYLLSLPGVGIKTAKCVLMYSLGRPVLPVDIHVLRVAKRLGVVPADASWDEVDRRLEADVPDDLKFDVHVQLVVHGRDVCKSRNPQCDACALLAICAGSHSALTLRSDYAR